MYLNEWGPIAWELFHFITYSYKPELHDYYTIFFNSLYALIPCPHCSNDIKNVLTSYPNYINHIISDKNSIIDWYINIHNQVNKKLNNNINFSRQDANTQYIKGNDLTISHTRIMTFIRLAIHVKGDNKAIDNGCFFKQNIISLCSVYPYGPDKYNPYLMYFINYKILNNDNYKDWFNTFEKIVLNPSYIKRWNNHKYPIRELSYIGEKDLNYLELISKPTNKVLNTNDNINITDSKYASIVLVAVDSNPTIITKQYKVYNNINKLLIYIDGVVLSNDSTIRIISKLSHNDNIQTKDISMKKKDVYKIEYDNIKKDSNIDIIFEFINKKAGDKYIIKNICLVGS